MCVRAHLPIGGYQPPRSVPSAVPQMKSRAALPGQGLCSSIPEIMRDISLLFFICLSFFLLCTHTCTLIHSFLSHPTLIQHPNTCSVVHLFTLIQRIMRLKLILKIILSLNLCQTDFFQSFNGIIPSDYLSLNLHLCQDRRLCTS